MEGQYLQLIVAPAPEDGGRSGFIIGRKVSPRAVDRNRIRRKLREVLRALPAAADRYDLVLRVKRGRSRREQDAATEEARRLLGELVAAAADANDAGARYR